MCWVTLIFSYTAPRTKPPDLRGEGIGGSDELYTWGIGSITQKHIHQNSVFSGIFYIQSGPKSGDLLLTQTPSIPTAFPGTLQPTPTEINILNSKVWAYQPKINDIIFENVDIKKSTCTNKIKYSKWFFW